MRDIVVAGMAIIAVGAGLLAWIFENVGAKNEDKGSQTEETNKTEE